MFIQPMHESQGIRSTLIESEEFLTLRISVREGPPCHQINGELDVYYRQHD